MRHFRLVALVRSNWPYARVQPPPLAVLSFLLAGLALLFASGAVAQERVETVQAPAPTLADAPVLVVERPARLVYGFLHPSSFGTNVPGTVAWTVRSDPTIVTAEARFPGLNLAITIEIAAPADGPLVVDLTWTGGFPHAVAGLEDVVLRLNYHGTVNRTLTEVEAVGDTHFRVTNPDGASPLDVNELLGMAELTVYFDEGGGARSLIRLEGGGNAEPRTVPRVELGPVHGPTVNLLSAIWLILWGTEIFVGFLLWRLVLGGSYARVGPLPLALAYALFAAVLFASSLVYIGMQFAQAFYGFFFAINFALPAITLSGVPLAAYFARVNDLNFVVGGILGMIVILATIVLRAGLGPAADGATFVELILASAAFFTGMIVWIRWQDRRSVRAADAS